MAKYKQDYFSWDEDLDLDALLGDYTADESENDSVVNDKICVYVCPDCKKEYKSISGFRGHVLKKHNKNLKVKDFRKSNGQQESTIKQSSEDSGEVKTSKFECIFPSAYKQSMKNLANDPMYNIFGTSPHPNIVKQCENNQSVENFLKLVMEQCFKGQTYSTVEEREVFFKNVHTVRSDTNLINDGVRTVLSACENSNFSRPDILAFIQDLIMDIIGEIFRERVALETKVSAEKQEKISETDNKMLFYISGYMIRALEKKYSKIRNKSAREKKLQDMKNVTSASSEKSFTDKYATWYDRKNRGGLKKPGDDFFFLIRECENIIRKSEQSECLKSDLKETILESFMVGHYTDKLFPKSDMDDLESDNYQCTEDIVNLFLTIRGFANAKLLQKRTAKLKLENKHKLSASLRGTLKIISNGNANV